MWLSVSLSIAQNCGDFKTFQIVKILILRIILRKLQKCKKNSKSKKILRKGMLVNTAPDLRTYNPPFYTGPLYNLPAED